MNSDNKTLGEDLSKVQERYVNVVLAARIGDAMGTPTENLTAAEIDDRFGWVSTFEGDGTDDSLMADILAAALVESRGFATVDDWGKHLVENRKQILDKGEYFFASVLHLLNKLVRGYNPTGVALGNMPSSSSAMCIWPVALVNPANPRGAAIQAYELATLIQVAPVDYCADAAAALAAAISSAFMPGSTIETVVRCGLQVIHPTSGRDFSTTLGSAIELARSSSSYESFRREFQARFARPIACDAMETVPAAFGLAVLANGDVKKAVEFGANFGRDSDTIACMTGALTGALSESLPGKWIDALTASEIASANSIAVSLSATAIAKNAVERERASATAGFLEVHQ